MERLTLSDYGRFKIPPPAGTKEKERPSYMDLYCRLAAIEDILGDEYDLGKLMELVQAKREGRCVVLPCKVGDTIYRVVHCDDGSGYAVWIIRVNFVEFNDNDSIELPNYVIGTTENGAGTTMEFSDFGKTAFTTREAAEEALKAREQDGNNK